MEKDENFSESGFTRIDHYSHHHHQHLQDHLMKSRAGQTSDNDNNNNIDNNHEMIDYTLSIFPPRQQQQLLPSGFCASTSLDKLSFADVMQFADFGPKLALNQTKIPEEEPGIDPGFFLRFPVLNQKLDDQVQPLMVGDENEDMRLKGIVIGSEEQGECREDEEARVSDNTSVQLRFLSDEVENKIIGSSSAGPEVKNKRKRPRTVKTSEEVESQRMTHIAVERNRRKQMNEHLRVLRSLMPGSYVQRGDQASIIGGAIEFVRELEQLLQCLESQKRRRMLGDSSSLAAVQQPQQPPFFGGDQSMKLVGFDGGLREERAENKSCVADVEVKLLGFDAMIKVLSRRRPGQLIKAIAALEDLQLNILHTNITTIEQTVLYSFNVKVGSETRCSAEDIATSVQQIFTFIHANTSTM